METTLPWESYDVFMADGNHFAMGVLWRFYGIWKPLRHGSPMKFLWQMETTSLWASYNFFYGSWKPLRHGRPVTFLWPMETTPMRVFMADGNHSYEGFYGRWKPLRYGRPVTFLWPMETTSPRTSYDVIRAGKRLCRRGSIQRPLSVCEVLCQGCVITTTLKFGQ